MSTMIATWGLGRTPVSLAALALLMLAGCDDSVPSALAEENPLEVTTTDPAAGERGETLWVHVYGEGFAEGTTVAWERGGVAATVIVVDTVLFVRENELLVSIRIADDSDIGLYDVAVVREPEEGAGSEVKATSSEAFEVKVSSLRALTHVAGMNDHGEVVGRQDCCAARWTETEGVVQFDGEGTYANGVNNHGWIVGRVQGDPAKAFIFEAGVITHLQADGPAGATAINDAGTILGGASVGPVVWRRDAEGHYGSPLTLPLVNDGEDLLAASPYAINEAGDVVGALVPRASGQPVVGALWRIRSDGTYDLPIVLGGSSVRWATGINDAGWVVGHDDGDPVLWHPDDYSTPITLTAGSGGGAAQAVNNKGQVAGHRRGMEFRDPGVNAGGTYRATLWQLDSGGTTVETTTLEPAPEYTDSDAVSLNDHGWVVGRSRVVRDNQGWVEEVTLWRPEP